VRTALGNLEKDLPKRSERRHCRSCANLFQQSFEPVRSPRL